MTSKTNYGWQSLTGHTRKFLSLRFLQVLLRLGLKLRHLTADKDHSIPQVRVANNLKNRISVLVTLGTLTFYSNATAILAVAYDSEGELRWHDENRQTIRINDSKDNERRVSGK